MMKYASLALLLSFALVGGNAHAQILDTTLNVNGNASTSDADTSVSTDASVDAEAVDSGGQGTAAANTRFDSEFSVLRRDLDEGTNYTVTSADSVRSSASMESYAAATVRADERLDSIEMGESGMNMTYRKPARFLWIIPASLKVHVTVENEGEVSVRYPWYAFLMSTDESKAALQAEIQNDVEEIDGAMEVSLAAEAAGTASGGVQGDPVIRRWAQIIEAVYIAVSGDARVDASAEAST